MNILQIEKSGARNFPGRNLRKFVWIWPQTRRTKTCFDAYDKNFSSLQRIFQSSLPTFEIGLCWGGENNLALGGVCQTQLVSFGYKLTSGKIHHSFQGIDLFSICLQISMKNFDCGNSR